MPSRSPARALSGATPVTTAGSRETFPDELRGFALLGIVFVNAPFLGISGEGFTPEAVAAWYDRAAAFAVVAFAQAKFYLLFAFLFGYSMHFIFKDDTPTSLRRFKRRLLGLAVLGVLHAVFLFVGDILLCYAVLGLALLWLRSRSDLVVRRLSIAALTAWLVLLLGLALLACALPAQGLHDDEALAASRAFDEAMREGGFWQAAAARMAFWPWAATLIATLNGAGVLAMFGFGLLAGRHHCLAKPQASQRLWNHGLVWGLVAGLPLGLTSAWLAVGPGSNVGSWGSRETVGIALGFAGAPLLSWGYVALIAKLHVRGCKVLALFRPAGRMSLTGYIGESLLLSLLFCAYGAGLFGQLGAAAVTACALATWVALYALACAAQRRGLSGPLDAMLRHFSAR